MTHDTKFEEDAEEFKFLLGIFELLAPSVPIDSCLRALSCASALGWIRFRELFDTGSMEDEGIRMDEYMHYSRSRVMLMPALMCMLVLG